MKIVIYGLMNHKTIRDNTRTHKNQVFEKSKMNIFSLPSNSEFNTELLST